MGKLDTVIRGGQVATASDTVACDVGIRDGRIVALGDDLGTGRRDHRRPRQAGAPRRHRQPCAFRPAERPRHRHGGRLRERHPRGSVRRQHAGHAVLPAAERREPAPGGARTTTPRRTASATSTSASTSSSPTRPPQVLGQELPALVADGYTSFKVFMTYRGPRAVGHGAARGVLGGARDRRAGDGACRELRRHPLPDRAAGAGRQDGAQVSRDVATYRRWSARRRTAPSRSPSSSTCRS